MAFDDVPQPETYAERVALARATLAEYGLEDLDVWVDDLGDASRAAFGDLPNSAIVIDPLGVIRLKLSWMDPAVLAVTLPEIQASLPKDRPAPVDHRFLDLVGREPPPTTHHRLVMLAHLCLASPDHPERERWLQELGSGPPQQNAWVANLRASRPAAVQGGAREPREPPTPSYR